MRAGLATLALALALGLGACSFVFVDKVPSGYRADTATEPPRCTERNLAGVPDFFGLVGTGVGTYAAIKAESWVTLPLGLAALAYAVALEYGWDRTRKCRAATRAWHDRNR